MFLGNLHGDQQAYHEDEDEEGEQTLCLAAQVAWEKPAAPV